MDTTNLEEAEAGLAGVGEIKHVIANRKDPPSVVAYHAMSNDA